MEDFLPQKRTPGLRQPESSTFIKCVKIFATAIKDRDVTGVVIYNDVPTGQITNCLIEENVDKDKLRPSSYKKSGIKTIDKTSYDCAKSYNELIAAIWLDYNCNFHGTDGFNPKQDIRNLLANPQFQPNALLALSLRIDNSEFAKTAQGYTNLMKMTSRHRFESRFTIDLSPNLRYGAYAFRIIRWREQVNENSKRQLEPKEEGSINSDSTEEDPGPPKKKQRITEFDKIFSEYTRLEERLQNLL